MLSRVKIIVDAGMGDDIVIQFENPDVYLKQKDRDDLCNFLKANAVNTGMSIKLTDNTLSVGVSFLGINKAREKIYLLRLINKYYTKQPLTIGFHESNNITFMVDELIRGFKFSNIHSICFNRKGGYNYEQSEIVKKLEIALFDAVTENNKMIFLHGKLTVSNFRRLNRYLESLKKIETLENILRLNSINSDFKDLPKCHKSATVIQSSYRRFQERKLDQEKKLVEKKLQQEAFDEYLASIKP